MSDQTKTVWTLPGYSQEFHESPQITVLRRTAMLKYTMIGASGEVESASITFRGVHWFCFTRDYSCTPEQIQAYDKIVEITPSQCVEQLVSRRPKAVPTAPVKHYRIYFDDVGCYDIAAEDLEASEE
jgi:hypothetical protein